MRRLISFIAMILVIGAAFVVNRPAENVPAKIRDVYRLSESSVIGNDPLDNMPIVRGGYGELVSLGSAPIEQRGVEFRRFLAPSVKIAVNGASGSGTICYYDPGKNLAYVASCGHMWSSGTMNVQEGLRRNITCKIIVWYHNAKKLPSTKEYPAKLIHYSYRRGCDTSLLTFQPDWVPDYFPVAPVAYDIRPGTHQHSVGCDGGREVAHYDVEIVGIQGADLITKKNSPRPGRSGGGLLSEDGYYIGTCWGTSDTKGNGIGYFTPLSVIHGWWQQQKGYEWLLNQQPHSALAARELPIVTRTGTKIQFPTDYIPLPN